MDPGSSGLVQFRRDGPVVVAAGDRSGARLHSPMETIGGGEVLDRSRFRLKAGKSFVIDSLRKKEEAIGSRRAFLLNLFAEGGYQALSEKDLAVRSSLPPGEARQAIDELLTEGLLIASTRAAVLIS